MDDSYQPFSQRESYDYFMPQQPTTSSPTSTSTASSPITTAMQNVSTGTNWPTRIFPFDSAVHQYDFDYSQRTHHPVWSLPHPQQHNVMPQHQLHNQLHYQQQHLIFRSHPDIHHPIYQNYDGVSQDLFQVPTTTTLPSEIYYAPPQEQHNVLLGMETQLSNANIPPVYTDSSNDDKPVGLTFKMEATTVQQDVETTLSPLPSITKLNRESVSPNTTPLSSPVLSCTRKRKRVGKATVTCTNSSLGQLGNSVVCANENERGVKRTKQDDEEEDEGVDGGTKQVGVQGSSSRKTVDQLERELDFLGDDCDTILMMLHSLRNAFLADIPASRLKSASKGTPLTSTFDSKEKNHIDQVAYAKKLTNQVPTMINTRRRSKIIAQNPEMEREIRTAYDDLMIQVRQVEKKVDALEGKRKNALHVDKEQKKEKLSTQSQSDNEEDTYSQSSCALSVLSEEDDDYLLESTKKRKITSTKG